ncbi:MAG TPA: hypothetical protein VF590_05475 [Isosphaeraceae bacterium]
MEFMDPGWAERERYWRRRLGRIRLGAEPLEQQLARWRRVTWALTAVSALIAAMFVALFAAFRAPAIGAIVAGVLLLPIVVAAWLEDGSRRRRVAAYLRERRDFEERRGGMVPGGPPGA